jgi:Family of unknown function (DUF6545)
MRELLLADVPTLLAWAAVLYRLPVLWRQFARPGLRANWFAHFALALALTFLLAPAYLAIDAALGVPNLARLLGHASVLIAGWCVTVYFANLALPMDRAQTETKRGGLALALALLLLVLFFRLANIGEEDAFDFTGHFSNRPFVLEYRLVFLVYLAWTMLVLIRLANRYAPVARDRPALAVGLRLLGVAGWLALAYVVHEGAWATASRLGVPYPVPQPEFTKEVLMAMSIGLLLVGATLPAWGPRVGVPELYRWYRQYRACRRLYPLWRDLCRAVPEVALVPPPSPLGDVLAVRGVRLRLVRRVIEIRDCRLVLRETLPATALDFAREQCEAAALAPAEEQATLEAACLAAALRARELKLMPEAAGHMPPLPNAADLEAEVSLLIDVAAAYQRSPIVRATREAAGEVPAFAHA